MSFQTAKINKRGFDRPTSDTQNVILSRVSKNRYLNHDVDEIKLDNPFVGGRVVKLLDKQEEKEGRGGYCRRPNFLTKPTTRRETRAYPECPSSKKPKPTIPVMLVDTSYVCQIPVSVGFSQLREHLPEVFSQMKPASVRGCGK